MPFPKWVHPLDNGFMSIGKVTLDRAGRVVLPKALRDELRLSPGDTLDLTVKGDEVTLRARRGATSLQKERGVWVFRNGEPLTADETRNTLGNIRTQRHRQNSGESR
ncbi:MAG TPA: AbrB/MazE/SpoVT family DNA-binding domain-containing protein [Terracidiphilus sp.]|nr:AbrB/MazE/SpoVT family DNA-binding domain-containing protein [Terracidiphilus sp.]